MGYYKQSRLGKGDTAGSKKPQGGKGSGYQTDLQWVTYRFTPEQKATIRESEFDVARFFDTLASLVEAGHKFTVSPNNSSGFVGASLFGVGEQCPNKGYGVSGEGGNLYTACKSLHWKLEFLQYDLRVSNGNDEDDFR